VNYRIAECCNPIPGDDILAFAEGDGVMIVHKRQCPVAMKLKSNFGERIISAVWETRKVLSFPATIEIRGIDRVGILNQIIKVISEVHGVNVNKVNLESKDGIFGGALTLYVHDVEDVNNLSMNILKINGINSVNRIN
jgi:GTP pyrophosphokinase